ncbi:MAG: HEAT repeat domain-containing protein [Pirellulaceae bacterium]
MKISKTILLLHVLVGVSTLAGCAEGPFWRLGRYSPWATQKWSEEEQLANTLFEQKKEMNEWVAAVSDRSATEQNEAASKLADIALRNPVLLVRLQAVRKLGELNCPNSQAALRQAYSDPDASVRLAVVEAWRKMSDDVAVPELQKILGSDTNIDVRLAATKALGDFPGSQSVSALRLALTDPDPAIRRRGTQSMARVTGESFGADIRKWQNYANQIVGDSQRIAQQDSNNVTTR